MRFYTGIGSRRAPTSVEHLIREVAQQLDALGYCLRSGGADGPDTWFERGSTRSEIYLPWADFNGHRSMLCAPTIEAFEIAHKFHPAWNNLMHGAKRLHARNVHQVLGAKPSEPVPSDFVVCWTPDGKRIGGTAQAMRIADAYNIPIFNLADDDRLDLFRTERMLDQIMAYALQKVKASQP